MASLDQVIGSLIATIARGRGQADVATLEVARAYQQHPLLATFPVPKMTVDEVVIDLKLAVRSVSGTGTLTDKERPQLLSQLRQAVKALIGTDPALTADDLGRLQEHWKSLIPQIEARFAEVLPVGISPVDSSIAGLAAVTKSYLSAALMSAEAKVPKHHVHQILNEEMDGIGHRLEAQFRKLICSCVADEGPGQIDVMVTAAELQSVPADRLTMVRLSLRSEDQVWTDTGSDEKAKHKLVPA